MCDADEREPEDPRLTIWMAEYQGGSIDAFNRLHDALVVDLKSYLTTLSRDATCAEDLLQETFLQIHRSRAAHLPGEPVRPWVFAIARRVFLMERRTASRRTRREQRSWAEATTRTSTSAESERLHARHEVAAVLRRTPVDARRAFVLHHLFGFSFKEVGDKLGIQPGAAKIRSSRAARAMRALLRGKRDE